MFTLNAVTKLIIPDPNKLLIPEFKLIWDNDKSNDKKLALEELSYIYYISDFKSPYVNAYPSGKLEEIVKEAFISNVKWKPSKDIQKAITKYKELQETKTIKLFQAADKAIDNLIKYFDEIKLEEIEDDKRHDIAAKVMNNLKQVAPVSSAIEEARKKVEKELSVKESSIRGKGTLKSRELPKNRR